jgi:hypothetical protein
VAQNDEICGTPRVEAYQRDLPNGECHLLDAGHFALETRCEELPGYVRDCMGGLETFAVHTVSASAATRRVTAQ